MTENKNDGEKYFERVREVFINAEKYVKTANYYFERHECGGENKKVMLDDEISNGVLGEKIRFGFCESCKTLFFMECKGGKSHL